MNDGLPSTISALSALVSAPQAAKDPVENDKRKKGKNTKSPPRKPRHAAPLQEESSDDDWIPEPVDDNLTIPGEPVLSKDRSSIDIYWPAEILEYKLPDHPKLKGRYLLRFLDGKQKYVTRNMFFTATEDGFATCTVSLV